MITYNWTRTEPLRNEQGLVTGWILGLKGMDVDTGKWAYKDVVYEYDIPQVLPLIKKSDMNSILLGVKKEHDMEKAIEKAIESLNNKPEIVENFSLQDLADS